MWMFTWGDGPWFWFGSLFRLAVLILGIIAVVDIAKSTDAQFRVAGSSKTTWLLLVILPSLIVPTVGLVLSIVYLSSIRPKVEAAGAPGRPLPPPAPPPK